MIASTHERSATCTTNEFLESNARAQLNVFLGVLRHPRAPNVGAGGVSGDASIHVFRFKLVFVV